MACAVLETDYICDLSITRVPTGGCIGSGIATVLSGTVTEHVLCGADDPLLLDVSTSLPQCDLREKGEQAPARFLNALCQLLVCWSLPVQQHEHCRTAVVD